MENSRKTFSSKNQRAGKAKTVPLNNPEWALNAEEEDLADLARKLVKGELPPEIKKGSEFYQLLAELAKQEGFT